uniref:Guanylate cyclase domain-containing protein n=1 Tax=Bicosoecida sp. CB-2014 TaxID=1486930 RepID=A0A7S1CAA5_9STRA|mmetsp:Transcript_17013/g.59559  ORF Transcript_17013/g.59559 Transcript_17013/m.59559 type:complete len:1548 (+) Transcript_17013:412-5055(+)
MRKNLIQRGGNRAVMKRELARERKRFKSRLSKIKGSIDMSEPKTLQLSHLRKNTKKAMQDAERMIQIQRENEFLVGRLSDIISRPPKHYDDPLANRSQARILSNMEKREKEQRRIDYENALLLKRIQNTESQYDLDVMLDEWEEREDLMDRHRGGREDPLYAVARSQRAIVAHPHAAGGAGGRAGASPHKAATGARELPPVDDTGAGPEEATAGKRKKRRHRRGRHRDEVGGRPEWNSSTGPQQAPEAGRKARRKAARHLDGDADGDDGRDPWERRKNAPHASELRQQLQGGKPLRKRGPKPTAIKSVEDEEFEAKLKDVSAGGSLGHKKLPADGRGGANGKGKGKGKKKRKEMRRLSQEVTEEQMGDIRVSRTVTQQQYGDVVREVVKTRYDGRLAVLVSDMSGFTRLTRKLGAHHFASLIMQMRRLMEPYVHAASPLFCEPHADNYTCIFESAELAVAAAASMYYAVNDYNKSVEDADYRVALGGIAVSVGDSVTVRGHEISGPVGDEANYLGEEVATKNSFIVTEGTRRAIDGMPGFEALSFEEDTTDMPIHGDRGEETSRPIKFYRVTLSNSAPLPQLPNTPTPYALPADAHEELRDFFNLAGQRLAAPSAEEREAIDKQIRDKYETHHTVVLIAGAAHRALVARVGEEAADDLHDIAVAMARGIMQKHGAICAEDSLFLFESSSLDAFLATMELRQELTLYNAGLPQHERLPVECAGIHAGNILVVQGSAIHWGDPVNIASKMAEDLGSPGQLLVSTVVRDMLVESDIVASMLEAGKIDITEKSGNISGVEFPYCDLTLVAVAETEAQDAAALNIQRVARGRNARRRVAGGKADDDMVARARGEVVPHADEAKAATRIQAVHRGRRARRQVGGLRNEHTAATKIQARHRGRRDRARVHELRSHRTSSLGQTLTGGARATDASRRSVHPKVGGTTDADVVHSATPPVDDEQLHATVRVQSTWRGHAARKQTKVIRSRRNNAAAEVQRVYRGRTDRRRVQTLRDEHQKATKLQAAYRGHAVRKQRTQRRKSTARRDEAAADLQRVFRGSKARKTVREQRAAATKVTAVARGRRDRKRVKQMADEKTAATKLTSVARGRRDRKRVSKLKEERQRGGSVAKEDQAATKLTSVARGRRDRKRVAQMKEEKVAATKLTSVARGRRDRRRVNEIREERAAAGSNAGPAAAAAKPAAQAEVAAAAPVAAGGARDVGSSGESTAGGVVHEAASAGKSGDDASQSELAARGGAGSSATHEEKDVDVETEIIKETKTLEDGSTVIVTRKVTRTKTTTRTVADGPTAPAEEETADSGDGAVGEEAAPQPAEAADAPAAANADAAADGSESSAADAAAADPPTDEPADEAKEAGEGASEGAAVSVPASGDDAADADNGESAADSKEAPAADDAAVVAEDDSKAPDHGDEAKEAKEEADGQEPQASASGADGKEDAGPGDSADSAPYEGKAADDDAAAAPQVGGSEAAEKAADEQADADGADAAPTEAAASDAAPAAAATAADPPEGKQADAEGESKAQAADDDGLEDSYEDDFDA